MTAPTGENATGTMVRTSLVIATGLVVSVVVGVVIGVVIDDIPLALGRSVSIGMFVTAFVAILLIFFPVGRRRGAGTDG